MRQEKRKVYGPLPSSYHHRWRGEIKLVSHKKLWQKKEKTALIFGWGGCAIAYSTGILFRLIEHYGLKKENIDMILTGSAWSSLGAFFVCDKVEERKKNGIKLFSSKNIVNPLRFRKIMDLDHLLYKVYPKKYNITSELIQKKAKNIDFHIAMTSVATWVATTFEAKERHAIELLRASMAIGIAYGRKVSIHGEKYIDGLYSQSVEFLTEQAFKKGAKKCIVITPRASTTPWRSWDDIFTRLRTATRNKKARKQIEKDKEIRWQIFEKYQFPKEWIASCYNNKILHISPITKNFKHEVIDNDIINLQMSVLHGKVDMTINTIIQDFLQNL